MSVKVTPRMLAAAEKALGREVDSDWLEGALEHHGETSLRGLKAGLKEELEDFERKGGRDVDQAEWIDGLRAVIAVRSIPKDPHDWSPRGRKKGK